MTNGGALSGNGGQVSLIQKNIDFSPSLENVNFLTAYIYSYLYSFC
ncbi:hypothetical protein ES705_36648 [subsurface metagenome]